MKITIPELSLIVMIGASGSGKSSFARRHFKPTQVLSSDFFRGLVSDDENDQSSTESAFNALHHVLRLRLAAARLSVIDATNVQPEARKPLVEIAREYHMLPVAIVLNTPERVCQERNATRPDRAFGPHVVRNQSQSLRRSLRGLEREGFRHVFILRPEDVESAAIEFQPLWNNRKDLSGPFDIIGDVHGCFDELCGLLERLGYAVDRSDSRVIPPDGRKAVFVGDLVDRGPAVVEVLKLVMAMERAGTALCVPGNHDIKLLRKLKGSDVRITHGLAESLEQLDKESPDFRKQVASFIDDMVSHYVFDQGKLVVAHAGLKESMQGRGSGKVRDFALYGETTGETDEYGLPVRYNWANDYRGRAYVVYGHTPVAEPEFLNRTINIDTGCVFGGSLTALRYPEMELVSVPAAKVYYQPSKPFLPESASVPPLTQQQQHDDLLNIEDVIGKRLITTRFREKVTIREENAIAALEVMSRFAVNPKWIIYLPPTMSPSETSKHPDLLEHPAEAFAYYLHEGIPQVICQEKHMGSRAVVIVCRDEDTARRRFGVVDEGIGTCFTRTGRRFFTEPGLEAEFLEILRDALDASDTWARHSTDWVCLDCELMPWSAKAQELLSRQYAPVGVAAVTGLSAVVSALSSAAAANPAMAEMIPDYQLRLQAAELYRQAYGRYCWEVSSVHDLKLAPFHLMATEGKVHSDKNHAWHMEEVARICAPAGLLLTTRHQVVDLTDPQSVSRATQWWEELTASGGEGMVVKPFDFVAKGRKGLAQPAVKCRGREYLRIIYGPEYTLPANLPRLKARGLSAKRSLALREFALGLEALERFVAREPLRRTHECVFGVLALESEPVDPRL